MANWWDNDEVAPVREAANWWDNDAPVAKQGGVMRAIDDFMRGAADTSSLGFSDELAAGAGALTGIGGEQGEYEKNLAAERARDEEGGWPRIAGQVAGAFTTPLAAARTVGRAALQSAGFGIAYGFGSGEGSFEDRQYEAIKTGVISAGAGAIGHKVVDALMNRAARKAVPSLADLKNKAQQGFDAAEAAGVIVGPQGMQRLATDTVGDLAEFGYHPSLQPKIGTVLSEMERLANTNTTYKGMETLRKMVGQVAGSNDAAERSMAMRIMGRLDDYMGNLPADDVITGNAAQAAAGIKQGRENWARMRRGEMVDGAMIKAERRAASTGTGGNLENTYRQNTRQILDNPRRSRGMTDAEKEMAEKVVRGTPTQDALRLVGRLSPTTGGLSAMMNVGATAVNPYLAIPGGIGIVAKALAERETKKNVEALSEMIRTGGQTAEDLAEQATKGIGRRELVDAIQKLQKKQGIAVPAASRIAAALFERMPIPF